MKWRNESMKIFISWSGDTSLEIAKILKEWIPCVIQNTEPYFSASDIDKGTRWSTDIAKELENANFGILCVTKENLNSSWLNFEAGSLSKAIDKAKVCPLLYDLKPSEITDSPILQFQMTNFDKNDMFKLFQSINNCLGEEGLDEQRLEKMFSLTWEQMQSEIKKIEPKTDEPSKRRTNQSDIMEEILELLRSQQILLRNPERLLPQEYLNSIMKSSMANKRLINNGKAFMLVDRWISCRDKIIKNLKDKDDLPNVVNDFPNIIGDFIDITERMLSYCGYDIYRKENFFQELSINADK